MEAREYFANGQLLQAIKTLKEAVKSAPQDIAKRDFLRELLCIAGELERADQQLDILAEQDARATMGVALARQLIRAEQQRKACFTSGRLPEFLGLPTPVLQLHLQALIEFRDKNFKQAHKILLQANQKSSLIRGLYNHTAFEGLRDLDDTCANFLELLTSTGKYYWLEFSQIKQIDFYPPERALDLIWRRAAIITSSNISGEVYLPATYIFTDLENESAKLGYETDWHSHGDVTTGIGQRMFLIGEAAISMMAIQNLLITELVNE